jgi:hypothetical protein
MPSDWKKFVNPQKDDTKPPQKMRGIYRYGQEILGLRLVVVPEEGPEAFVRSNPQLFATASTSRDEGYAYWALLKLIGEPREVGRNGMVWYYQSKVGGASNLPGGAIVDFVIETNGPNPLIGIRVVTPHFHLNAGAGKRATDLEQALALVNQDMMVVDVFSQNYIYDKSGKAVIKSMSRAINGMEDFGPAHRRWKLS